MLPDLLTAIAVLFALATGANDGGALIAPGLRVPALSVPVSLAAVVAALVAYPLIVSTAVADTMLHAIVSPDADGAAVLAAGFIVAVAVVLVLTRRGLPTSLTLAVIGGIAGSGLGAGSTVAWSTVGRVLVIGAAAPAVGVALAMVFDGAWRALGGLSHLSAVRGAHVAAFTTQCVAYGANDGQKVLVLFLAAGVAGGDGDPALSWWVYPVIASAFAVGAALGLPRVARSVGTGIVSTRGTQTVTAEFAAAAAVLGSSAAGTPVSMTQAVAGGLLGAGLRDSARRVRWRVVRNLALAWLLTLPAAVAVGALVGLAWR